MAAIRKDALGAIMAGALVGTFVLFLRNPGGDLNRQKVRRRCSLVAKLLAPVKKLRRLDIVSTGCFAHRHALGVDFRNNPPLQVFRPLNDFV